MRDVVNLKKGILWGCADEKFVGADSEKHLKSLVLMSLNHCGEVADRATLASCHALGKWLSNGDSCQIGMSRQVERLYLIRNFGRSLANLRQTYSH